MSNQHRKRLENSVGETQLFLFEFAKLCPDFGLGNSSMDICYFEFAK